MPELHAPYAQSYDDGRRPDNGRVSPEARSFAPPAADSLAFPFIAGRAELSVRLTARPLFDLRRRAPAGVHLSRSLSRAFPVSGPFGGGKPRLEPADVMKLDAATLQRGLDLLRNTGPGAVVSPACWSTIASPRGRFSLLYAGLKGHPDATRLLVEVLAAPPDLEAETLQSCMSHIEAQQRGLLLRSPPDLSTLHRLESAGLKGVSLDLTGLDFDTAIGRQAAQQVMVAARRVAPSVMVLGLPASLAEEAASAGATHAVMCERVAVTV
ncbi:hypothetical protein [Brevundimonas sp.]|uniref:hypothetical protein n=1 Tax=Brevundimonas sp. TaxID=1871086 RepID=UPI0025E78530|nr:hypothetical protein [Brevundimonas sp.]